MKQFFIATLIALTTVAATAHSDHAPRVAACIGKLCTKDQVEKGLPTALDILISKGTIEKTWKSLTAESIEEKIFKKNTEWVAKFTNPKQKDDKKKNLYVFITQKGFLAGSNFTGE